MGGILRNEESVTTRKRGRTTLSKRGRKKGKDKVGARGRKRGREYLGTFGELAAGMDDVGILYKTRPKH
jgi:hypothetical protein